jgi:hypothetical protein
MTNQIGQFGKLTPRGLITTGKQILTSLLGNFRNCRMHFFGYCTRSIITLISTTQKFSEFADLMSSGYLGARNHCDHDTIAWHMSDAITKTVLAVAQALFTFIELADFIEDCQLLVDEFPDTERTEHRSGGFDATIHPLFRFQHWGPSSIRGFANQLNRDS